MAGFKVAIVGGGMTGLTAALALDRVGIDFVLLEAYNDITPEVGASLALYPNFQRVCNQLGVLGEIRKESIESCTLSSRDVDGKVLFQHDVSEPLHAATGGYGIQTFTRSQLLRILHRNMSEEGKKKIRTGQRISRIEELSGDEGVRVHLKNGDFYDADLVIGADGTHSTVRSEMWRLAEEAGSNIFKGDQREDMDTEFGCVFGLSSQTGDLRNDQCYQVCSQDMTIGIFGNHNNHALWFLFFKVDDDKRNKGGELPQWTEEEGKAICEKLAHAKLNDTTTFGDVYANHYRLTTQACPNHTLRRWTWGRIICLGDAVAKTNPILAQGGAQGAESVLMLVDELHEALSKHKQAIKTRTAEGSDGEDAAASEKLPTAEVKTILSLVNAKREPRVRAMVDKSQELVRIAAWSSWLFRLVGKYILPLLPTWVLVSQALGPWRGSYVSRTLPEPVDPSTL